MKFLASAGCIAGVLLVSSSLCPAVAQDFSAAAPKPPFPVIFVSGKGVDNAGCGTQVKPCRTFKFAVTQTSANGEIKALDPADYGPVTITKSISLTGFDGAGIDSTPAGGTAITINANASDTINIRNLILDGAKIAGTGIILNSGGSLSIVHCTVRNFTVNGGILLTPIGTTSTVLIADVIISNDGHFGIGGVGPASVTVRHAYVTGNATGILHAFNNFTLADSLVANNSGDGISVTRGGFLLVHSIITRNNTGIVIGMPADSDGNNFIDGNTTNLIGTLNKVGTQ